MTRLDCFLLALGPVLILLIWALLPAGATEGSRSADGTSAAVVAELVGYAAAAPDPTEDPRPRTLGRGTDVDVRLHRAPIARHAAMLLPPTDVRAWWAVMPAQSGLTLRRVGSRGAPTPGRVSETSWRPWTENTDPIRIGCSNSEAAVAATMTPVRLRQFRLWGTDLETMEEPEILWIEQHGRVEALGAEAGVRVVSCEDERVWWRPEAGGAADRDPGDPCGDGTEGWKKVRPCWIGRPAVCQEPFNTTWGVRIEQGGESRLHTPWGEPFASAGISLSQGAGELRSLRLGLEPSSLDNPQPIPICPANDGPASDGPVSDVPLETLGALDLRDGDLLRIGRTRFLVRATQPGGRLELLHVRNPRAPGYFPASSGHDAYHPNRQAMWPLPACDTPDSDTSDSDTSDSDTPGDALTLLVQPKDSGLESTSVPSELALHDRAVLRQVDAGAQHRGVPHEIPAVTSKGVDERSLLTLCAARGANGKDDEITAHLRLGAPARGIFLTTSNQDPVTAYRQQDEVTVLLGSEKDPREVLIEMDGNLIRLAPAANPRITRHARRGLAGYLIFVLVLNAVPLTLARQASRLQSEAVWPADLGASTLQQLAGMSIVILLFVGANFQLFLALHPDLAGKPDYAQAFLQGVIVVATALSAAAGFTIGTGQRTDPRMLLPWRLAGSALGASLAFFGAGVWWWLERLTRPDGLWLTALRDQASAASGAGPEAFGQRLFQAAGIALLATLLLYLSGRFGWARLAEWLARRGLRSPVLGFCAFAAAGLGLGIVEGSALAFELGILAGLAWFAGVYWAYVRQGRRLREDGLRRQAAWRSLGSGILILAFLVTFFLVGADLPDPLSFASVAIGIAISVWSVRIMIRERFTSLLRVLLLWAVASAFGAGFASLVLTDMGSIAAWIPAVLTGFFLWLVRPEEQGSRVEDPKKATTHLILALGLGMILLGVLDVFKTLVQGIEWQALDRPRQRLDLAEDVSYITAGEWITQVRWLASHQDGDFQWVPNVNSDVAIFGLSSGVGTWLAVLASLLVLSIAGCAGLAADQALREGHAAAARSQNDRLVPALYRGLGLLLGMISVLLICQWLVHLSTGVVLHLPITGLVFPWISHGNTTHLLYAAALTFPMAAISALGGRRKQS